jgi:hypothetical protein
MVFQAAVNQKWCRKHQISRVQILHGLRLGQKPKIMDLAGCETRFPRVRKG